MRIMKEFVIQEVKATRSINVPFQIMLTDNPRRINQEDVSSLVLDANICTQYNIPIALNLIGRALMCSFENRELSLENDRINSKSLGNDDLQIQSLKKNETESSIFYSVPPSKYTQVLRILELSSFGGGNDMHVHIMPCPFYRFIIEWTDEKYDAYKALPAHSVFKVHFGLA